MSLITLHLSGQLAKDFGDTVSLSVSSPREAVTALAYQCPKYRDILVSNDWHIFVGDGNDISDKELDMGLGNVKDIYLMPVIQGANNGVFNTILGAILIVVGYFTSWTGVGAYLIPMGVGLMVGGIMQMTTKIPGSDEISRESADNKSSFLFNNPTNTSSQGVAIPRGYGRALVGSVVVSAAIYAEQIENVSPDSDDSTIISDMIVGDIIGKNGEVN